LKGKTFAFLQSFGMKAGKWKAEKAQAIASPVRYCSGCF
jgi:hypothetical protein